MKKYMEYKGYTGTVEYSEADNCLWGRIAGINDVISYEGQSVAEIREAFEEAIDCYLDDCASRGKEPDKPYAGPIIVSVEPELRVKLETQAIEAGMTLNQLITAKLATV